MTIPRLVLLGVAALVALPAVASADCLPSCGVGATAFGYAPALVAVESGDSVTWTSLDLDAHTATSAAFCVHAPINPSLQGRAFFRIENGSLQASSSAAAPWKTCNEASALPQGGFALAYKCVFHGTLQQGVVVVTP